MLNHLCRHFTYLIFLLCFSAPAWAQIWTNGQAASFVLGQPGFTTAPVGLSATTFNLPHKVIVDAATRKVFVADANNNRILRYATLLSLTNGAAAEAVLGQTDFVTATAAATATGLNHPTDICMDNGGSLWVADEYNSRILRYDNAATISSGTAASGVLGQPNFTATTTILSVSGMNWPMSIALHEATNTLWVNDFGNQRILRFDNVSLKANGSAADGVLGTGDFTSIVTPGCSATRFNGIYQIYVNNAGDLWVADYGNSRVIKFESAHLLPNGGAASVVLGQPDFTSNNPGFNAAGLWGAIGVYGDVAGRIYVSSYDRSRVLIFEPSATLVNGSSASRVIGQTTFLAGTNGTNASKLHYPHFLFVEKDLWVADAYNSRVLAYHPAFALPLRVTYFSANWQAAGTQVQIKWNTIDEMNVAHFELQYSCDGVRFDEVINRQQAKHGDHNMYSFLYTTARSGNHYYRLRTMDTDGNAILGPVISIKSTASVEPAITIYPNPLKGGLLYLQSNIAEQVKLEIFDVAGRLVKAVQATTLKKPVDVHELAAGMYTVRICYEGGVVTRQILK